MFQMNLVYQLVSEDRAALSLPIGFRILFLGITALLVAAMATTATLAAVPLGVAIFTTLAALYQERWEFDRAGGVMTHKFGLVFLVRRKETPLEEVKEFVITNYREPTDKNIPSVKDRIAQRSLITFAAEMEDGRLQQVEIRNNKHNDTLQSNAKSVAAFCSKPLGYRD